jgi:hypothetical protein
LGHHGVSTQRPSLQKEGDLTYDVTPLCLSINPHFGDELGPCPGAGVSCADKRATGFRCTSSGDASAVIDRFFVG